MTLLWKRKPRLAVELLETRATPSATTATGYDYSRLAVDKKLGSQNLTVASTALGGGLALQGGGTDIAGVYTWMATHGAGGDFLMIGSAASTSGNYYNNPVKSLLGSTKVNSISTLMVSTNAGASSSFVVNTVRNAEAIFILGGDQSTYVNLWGSTPLATEIAAAARRGVPVGGTSAGLAVLGQYAHSAQYVSSAVSSTVLQNPYDPSVTIVKDFLSSPSPDATQPPLPLPYFENTITDSHFYERDRMGRLATFMARIEMGSPAPTGPVKGIGVDEQTALLIETKGTAAGTAKVVANPSSDPNKRDRHVYFLESPGLPTQCVAGQPLIYSGIMVHRASVGDAPIVLQPPAGSSTVSLWDSMQTSPKDGISDYLVGTYVTATGTVLKKQTTAGPDLFIY